MATMTSIYRLPGDLAFFEKHYFEVHIRLAKELPGLIKYEINDGGIISTTSHTETFRIANLYFKSMDALKEAFWSEIGKRCVADRRVLAGDGDVQIYLYETKET